jgi:curved DNA-binding protein CbpA
MRDLYRVLQVDPAADPDVIAAAYRVLARKLHPDRGGHQAALMTELNAAYAVLRNRESRAQYDRDRRAGIQPGLAAQDPEGVPFSTPSNGRLDFGRYEGWTLRDVAGQDIDYLRWLSRHASSARHRQEIAMLLREFDAPKGRGR